ncbi:30S ribosomal protein S17e [Candidatus Woesearchaeota archaeon]|nr:30S ribosomal protein S17e [Candidatus Woesearchaeota archaeon]RLE41723.1 MAG: 30S ribosomal protein S17e [Candidatus Woesearchaeota archaeon]RLE43558.1 MAG: 30S ribosomal protein S17e [Candidatus Woesearchaeota archaeon]
MGRIKTALIKRITQDLMKLHGDKFTTDFETNKQLVAQFTDIQYKKLRNVIAGYVTRLVKAKKEKE